MTVLLRIAWEEVEMISSPEILLITSFVDKREMIDCMAAMEMICSLVVLEKTRLGGKAVRIPFVFNVVLALS